MAGPPTTPIANLHGEKDRRAITLANLAQPVSTLALLQRPSNASKPTREPQSRRRRPFLFETLRASLLTRIVADTLDWDGKF